ncbi:transcriptional regulator [bacterium]|nr:MAG: transcriptional regulator [bacterium]
MDFFRKIRAIVWKDLTSEFRTKEMLSAMLIFAFLTIVIFVFAFDPSKALVKEVFPGIIWVSFIFAGILGLNRSFLTEKSNDCIMGLMLCPVDRSAIFFGKMIGNFIFMAIMEIISLPVFAVLFNYRIKFSAVAPLVIIIFLGTLGFIASGTFLAAMSSNTRNSEILLPIILFPLIVPVVLGAVQATAAILNGAPAADWLVWLKIIIAFDAIFLVVPLLLFEYVLEV